MSEFTAFADAGETRCSEQEWLDGQISSKPIAAFAKAFRRLPDDVKMWSKQNIFQFEYPQGRTIRQGSFSLNAADRSCGYIAFDLHAEFEPQDHRGWVFGRSDGVKVTRVTPRVYVVYFDAKAVVFRLNEKPDLPPGEARIRGGETYLGAVEDQSGLGFFLIRQRGAQRYFYTLDEARLNEVLKPIAHSGQIRIGERSGFAYYRDRYLPRWILIGVRLDYATHNSLYDGPFEQMPEPPSVGSARKEAVKSSRTKSTVRTDRSDNFAKPVAGVLVRPYMLYRTVDELSAFDQCAARAADRENYYRCFANQQKR